MAKPTARSTYPFGPFRAIGRPGHPELRVSSSLDEIVRRYVLLYDSHVIKGRYGRVGFKPVDPRYNDLLREVGYNLRAVREVLLADGLDEQEMGLDYLTRLPNQRR